MKHIAKICWGLAAAALLAIFVAGGNKGKAAPQAPAAPFIEISSGPRCTALIELYTSQGCSSCPPAEMQLNQLTEHPGLWKDFVPVNFHVDYWDGLGWKDPYASRANTNRQYALAGALGMNQVYTPEFFLNGKEWRTGFDLRAVPGADAHSAKAGVLSARAIGNWLDAQFAPAESPAGPKDGKQWTLHCAVLGFGIETEVARGENAGRRLRHDFAALALTAMSSEDAHWKIDLRKLAGNSLPAASRYGLALWVGRSGEETPVQAAGCFIAKEAFLKSTQ